MIPELAILGHPNEGKSSVLSTLAEDDSVRISPLPGETRECRTFPVVVDGREVLRFTDTPGFQNPGKVLVELKRTLKQGAVSLEEFLQETAAVADLHDDRELLTPVARGAGIIYVVDGSRPVRNVDRAEMEILRLTGKPRLAIINSKEEDRQHLEEWKQEFRKSFNAHRVFNAHRATYAERISLLEALGAIDQDWQRVLSQVVAAFIKDWQARNETTVQEIMALLSFALTLQLKKQLTARKQAINLEQELLKRYQKQIREKEAAAHQAIRVLFKHNIFDYQLPDQSILHEDLFAARTWELLGLTRKQAVIAGGIGGGALGAGVDVAALGHGLGLFTALGTVAGAVGAFFGGEDISRKAKLLGIPLGSEMVSVGPARNMDMLFVLMNRALLFYSHVINWAHGRRDYPDAQPMVDATSFTQRWSAGQIRICHKFFKQAHKNGDRTGSQESQDFAAMLLACLQEIAEDRQH